jgi:hypothetical protein
MLQHRQIRLLWPGRCNRGVPCFLAEIANLVDWRLPLRSILREIAQPKNRGDGFGVKNSPDKIGARVCIGARPRKVPTRLERSREISSQGCKMFRQSAIFVKVPNRLRSKPFVNYILLLTRSEC